MTNSFVQEATTKATKYLVNLARRRKNKTVTADDLQRWYSRNPNGLFASERPSVTSRVFRRPNFVAAGRVNSARPEAKGRTITAWTINS